LQAETAVVQSGRDLRVAQQRLSEAIGQDDFSVLAVTGTWAVPPLSPTLPDFNRGIEQTPPGRAQQTVVEQPRAPVHAARSAIWPTLSLRYNKGYTGDSEFPKDPFWTFTGLINLPIFAGGPTATWYASEAAVRTSEKAQADLLSLRRRTR